MSTAQLVYEMSRMALCESDGNVVVIKVAMDESGVHDGSPVLTVAAYVARPSQWRDWTKRWNAAKRPIKVYHAVDSANLAGEFKGWTPDERDAVAICVLDALHDADIPGVVIGLHMDEYRKAIAGKPELAAILGSPYGACFHWVVQAILNIAIGLGSDERIAFVHECNDYQREALQAFSWIKKIGNPNGNIVSLQFADKKDYVPLQAADVLAYEGNKRMRDPDAKPRRPWRRLNPDRRILAAHYGRNNMPELIDRLEKVRTGRFSEIDQAHEGWNRAHFWPGRDVPLVGR